MRKAAKADRDQQWSKPALESRPLRYADEECAEGAKGPTQRQRRPWIARKDAVARDERLAKMRNEGRALLSGKDASAWA